MAAAGVDEDFQRMWDETTAEYKTMTGRDLRDNVSLEAENLLANIKEEKVDDEEKQKWKKSKEYLRNSLKCISILGSIAVQGVTMVSVMLSLPRLISTNGKRRRSGQRSCASTQLLSS